jgi:hypothetical protein
LRTALFLVFRFRDDALRLAEILLVEPVERGRPAAGRLPMCPVIALYQQIIDAVDASRLGPGRRKPGGCGQLHAQRFVENHAVEPFDRGFENMRTGCAAERQRNVIAFDADGDFVLCSRKRKTYSLIARQKRAFRKFPENCRKFVRRELAIAVMLFRQFFARRNKSDGPRALAADLLQHGVIVARADAEIPGDDFAFGLFGQDSAEEAPAFIAREALFP